MDTQPHNAVGGVDELEFPRTGMDGAALIEDTTGAFVSFTL